MKTEKTQNSQEQQALEEWTKPSIISSSIREETQGNTVAGPDFGSEIS